ALRPLCVRGFQAGADGLHLLPIRTVQTRRRPAGHPAEQDQLRAVVNQMMQELVPEHVTEREAATVDEDHGLRELIIPEIPEPGARLLVDATVSWREQRDLARPFEIRRLVLEAEPPKGDAEGQAGVDLAQVPGHLSDRAPFGVGAEVILIGWERFQQSQRVA